MPRWVGAVVVGALLAWTALATPLSLVVGESLAYYDPQSDPQRLDHHRDLAVHVYTAGHWLGQLVAALGGALSGAFRRATVVRAALAGGLLGLGVGAVAIVAGLPALRANGYPSVAADPTMLADPAVRWCLLASVACFPLWTLLGAAIAGLLRRGAVPATVAVFLCQPATLLLSVGLAAPPSSHPMAVSTIGGAGPAAMLLPAILAAWALVATAAAARRSRVRPPSPGPA